MAGAHTTFTNGSTLSDASWFQDVDTVTYTLFGNGTTYTGALTLGSSGNIAVNTNKFTVAASSGNTLVAGTLSVTSDIAVNTNKFTVTASNGNTLVAGTLAVTGVSSFTGIASFFGSATIQTTAAGTYFRVTESGSGDGIRMLGNAAGSGASIEGTNNANNASTPLQIKGSAVSIGTSNATNATTGYFSIPTSAGSPTGVPSGLTNGTVAFQYDRTNNKLWVYNGGWLQTSALT